MPGAIAAPMVARVAAAPGGFVRILLLVALAGAALRGLHLLTIARDTVGIGDWWFYHRQANLLAAGHGFVDPFQLELGNPGPSAGHPPLYPLLLSAVSWLGGTDPLWHRALGVPLGAVTIVLVGLLGRRIGGAATGLVAAAIAAVYPVFVGVDGALMSEVLLSPLVAAALLAALWLVDRPGRRPALVLGALIGLAALTRSETLLLGPLVALPAAVLGGRGWAQRTALCALAAVVVLAPWSIRNADAFGRFVPVSTNDSTVLAGANCDLTYSGQDLGGWNIACISPRRERDEARQAVIWRDEGLAYAREHAGRLPVVAAVRLLRAWDLWQPRRQVLFAEGRHVRVQQAGIAVYFGLLALAAFGVAALRRRRDALVVLLAPALIVCMTAVVGYGVSRLRHVFEVPLVVLAAVGVVTLAGRWSRRGTGR